MEFLCERHRPSNGAEFAHAHYDHSQPEDILNYQRALKSLRISQPDDKPLILNIGEGAAPLRFFLGVAVNMGLKNPVTVCGEGRLPFRPVKPLADALNFLGAKIELPSPDTGRQLPLIINPSPPIEGGVITLRSDVSSQYISALMMASSVWSKGIRIIFEQGRPVSFPYIEMTAEIMRSYGADVALSDNEVQTFPIKRERPYTPVDSEADWSAASYLYEAAALNPDFKISVNHLPEPCRSLQGDSVCAEIFRPLGVATTFHNDGSAVIIRHAGEECETYSRDMTDAPDLVPALVVALALREIPFNLTGVRNLRIKESDRLEALKRGLQQLGYFIETGEDSISGDRRKSGIKDDPKITIESCSDHRIAMAFGVAMSRYPNIKITHPECVAKSFPDFWRTEPKLWKER